MAKQKWMSSFFLQEVMPNQPPPPQTCVSLYPKSSTVSLRECCKYSCTNCDTLSICSNRRFSSQCGKAHVLGAALHAFRRLISNVHYKSVSFPLKNSLQSCLALLSSCDPARVEAYLRLTGEGHPTDGETAKHTLPAHSIDVAKPPAAEQPVFERGQHHLRGKEAGGGGVTAQTKQEESWGKSYEKKRGTIPLLMAHRQIMEVINGERKTRENELEPTKRHDRKSHTEQKPAVVETFG